MSTNFPDALDVLTNPAGTDSLTGHASQHANTNDAIEALQAKVGINGSAVATSLDYRISTAETGLGGKISSSEKGSANGVATLGFDGKVPSSQLPPLDYIPTSERGAAGGVAGLDEAGKVPAAQLPSCITSGAVDSVAGKTGAVTLAKGDVGLGNVDNTSDANKPVSTAQQTALNGKENTGTAAAAVAAHEAAGDPHPQYQVDLVSGTNIKTINGQSILGAGNIEIQGGVGVALSGDLNIYVTQSKTYTITNYNVFSSYIVQVSAGSVSLSGDQISFTTPTTAQTVTLTVTMDSAATQFSLVVQAAGVIGTQGGQGFGVGEYSGTLPSGFSAMTGTSDKGSANYGNYQYSDGSIMVFVPRFYYRIGNAASPRYATYGANAIDIVGIDTYATEVAANTAGYAMHRAFKDGGADKSGFFIDKYLASKNGTTSCKSVQNGVPISLTTTATYTNSNGMTTGEGSCTGIYADAVLLARSRGVGTFNVASVFMYSALAMLALAHAQASSNTTYCAWYDATNNFPKGCNNGSLADANDAGVTFTTAGDSGSSAKPKTGSGSPFAKTTHNGQSCGVADLNGALYQVMLGITNAGTSATDTTQKTDGDAYVLKTSVALSSLTYGFNGTNDAWGDTTNLATKYDLETGLFPWGSTTGWTYFGSGANQVFSGATSGISWKRTACGIQNATSGADDATGTSQFGNDGCYQYNRASLCALSAGDWSDAATAGVFCRGWSGYWSDSHSDAGFRAGAYGS